MNLHIQKLLIKQKINEFQNIMKKIVVLFLFFLCVLPAFSAAKSLKSLLNILVIGIDGLGAHGIKMSKTPVLNGLMANGAWSLEARTVMPSVSGPAWSSILTGATVERHGIGNNGWNADQKVLEPVFKGDHNMFPTIFGEIRKNLPQAVTGAIYHWGDFGNFIEKGVCDLSKPGSDEDVTTKLACDFLADKAPLFTFIQLDNVDHGGHHGGYRSDEYRKSVEKADSLVGVIINQLKKAGLYEKTVIFIVSDHGGIGTGHGGTTPDEMIVPLIISGKGIKKGYEINHPVFIYDLAPTVASLLGFRLNEWVSGKPLVDAYINSL
jgi:predicted AlkP superfamily pyrophosphatase or phosphodiesterase